MDEEKAKIETGLAEAQEKESELKVKEAADESALVSAEKKAEGADQGEIAELQKEEKVEEANLKHDKEDEHKDFVKEEQMEKEGVSEEKAASNLLEKAAGEEKDAEKNEKGVESSLNELKEIASNPSVSNDARVCASPPMCLFD